MIDYESVVLSRKCSRMHWVPWMTGIFNGSDHFVVNNIKGKEKEKWELINNGKELESERPRKCD